MPSDLDYKIMSLRGLPDGPEKDRINDEIDEMIDREREDQRRRDEEALRQADPTVRHPEGF